LVLVGEGLNQALRVGKSATKQMPLYEASQSAKACLTVAEHNAYLRVAAKGIPTVIVWWADMQLVKRH
jgi:hypothetical protein